MANNLIGKRYNDMPEEYRNENSRSEFRNDRRLERRRAKDEALSQPRANRMAGDEIFKVVRGESFQPTSDRKDRIDSRIARTEARREAGKTINEDRLQRRLAKQERLEEQIAAQKEFDGTLDSYNFGSFGRAGAGIRDLERLSAAGFGAQEIADEIDERGINRTGRVEQLLAKYLDDNKSEDIIDPTDQFEGVSDEGSAFEPPTEINVDPTPVAPPPGTGFGGGGSPTIATGVIGGDTGDVSLTDSDNYGTINTGIINDIRNYGGGYAAGSNNTGTAQAYVDLMQENWEKYSGDKYGMYITDKRTEKADELRGINSEGIYGSMGQFAGNMYDRGLIGASNLYGDPYKFPTAQYGGFQDIG